jgi:hypothetical protein
MCWKRHTDVHWLMQSDWSLSLALHHTLIWIWPTVKCAEHNNSDWGLSLVLHDVLAWMWTRVVYVWSNIRMGVVCLWPNMTKIWTEWGVFFSVYDWRICMTLCEIHGIASVKLLEPSNLAQVVMLVTYRQEMHGFYLSWNTNCFDRFLWFSSVHLGKCLDGFQK